MHFSFNWYQGLYSPSQVQSIVDAIDSLPSDIFSRDKPSYGSTKSCSVKIIRKNILPSLLDEFFLFVLESNRSFYGFDLFNTHAGETVNYNTYHLGQEYTWHVDGEFSLSRDIKLTALLNLSEYYEGGDLELFLDEPKIIEEFRLPGAAIVFPSFIPHRVTPVTKGSRKTLTYLCNGPNWK